MATFQCSVTCVISLMLPSLVFALDIKAVLDHAGHSAGVGVVLPAGDQTIATQWAAQPGWSVIAAESDPAKIVDWERVESAQPWLGRTLFPVESQSASLPLADHLADVMVLPAGDASPEMLQELARVSSPVRGLAIFTGRAPKAEPDPTVWEVDPRPLPEGVGAVWRRRPLPGSDWWTHRMHDAGNNAASADTALQAPIGMQYLATPLHTSFQGLALTGNGRHIEVTDSAIKNPSRTELASRLRARSIYNGTILWDQPLPEGYEPDFPTAALYGDTILLADPDKPEVRVLHAETGKQTGVIRLHEDDALRVHWIGVDGGRLHALLGPPFPKKAALQFIGVNASKKAIEGRSVLGSAVVAVDLNTGKPLWTHTEGGKVDYRQIGVRDGKTIFFHFGERVVCLGPDGAVLWENRDPTVIEELRSPATGGNLNSQSSPLITLGPTHLRLGSFAGRAFFFRMEDGQMTAPTGGQSIKGFFLDGQYRNATATINPDTGQKEGTSDTIGRYTSVGGCGMVTWIPGLDAGVSHSAYGFKSPCGIGTWSAGGALLINPSHCDCSSGTVRGASAFLSVGDLYERITERPEHPHIVHGPAPAPSSEAATGWAQYGGGPNHANASSVALPTTTPTLRHVPAASPLVPRALHDTLDTVWYDRPGQALAADGRVVWSDSSGQITAVNAATGEVAWRRQLGMAILGSPILQDGMVIVPGTDGWVRALRLADGQTVWEWRAAPADRRIMVFGKCMSSWPVISLTEEGGRLYGIAGLAQTLGSMVFCLDPATGKPLWTSLVAPDFRSGSVLPPDAFTPAGELMVVDGKVWIRSDYLLAIVDAETGERLPYPKELDPIWEEEVGFYFPTLRVQGRDMIRLRDDLILQGGNSLFDDTAERRTKKQEYMAFSPAADGSGNFEAMVPIPFAVPNARSAPASDGEQLAVIGGQESEYVNVGLSLWEIDDWKAAIQGVVDKAKAAEAKAPKKEPTTRFAKMIEAKRQKWAHLPTRPRKAFLPMEAATWAHPDLELNAVALGSNAVVAAHGKGKPPGEAGRHPGFERWALTAFDRADGKELWSVPLPHEPIYNGVSIDESGRVIVVHRDGSATIVGG